MEIVDFKMNVCVMFVITFTTLFSCMWILQYVSGLPMQQPVMVSHGFVDEFSPGSLLDALLSERCLALSRAQSVIGKG